MCACRVGDHQGEFNMIMRKDSTWGGGDKPMKCVVWVLVGGDKRVCVAGATSGSGRVGSVGTITVWWVWGSGSWVGRDKGCGEGVRGGREGGCGGYSAAAVCCAQPPALD